MEINGWNLEVLDEQFVNKIKSQYNRDFLIFPKYQDVFRVYELTSPDLVKVVILGQDPYPTKDVADGLAFSTKCQKTPKSLLNIFKEMKNDLGIIRTNNNLEDLSRQGVFLINSTLIVKEKEPGFYKNFGFDELLIETIDILNSQYDRKIIFLLMGNQAQKLKNNISKNHIILETSHPSPLSAYRGFFGSNVFSRINFYLKIQNTNEIKWG